MSRTREGLPVSLMVREDVVVNDGALTLERGDDARTHVERSGSELHSIAAATREVHRVGPALPDSRVSIYFKT
jgi:hypothetical protein